MSKRPAGLLETRVGRRDTYRVVVEPELELGRHRGHVGAAVHPHHVVALFVAARRGVGRIHLVPLTERRTELQRAGRIAGSEGRGQQIPGGKQAERGRVPQIDELHGATIVAFAPRPGKPRRSGVAGSNRLKFRARLSLRLCV